MIFRFALHHLVQDYLDTGWHIANVDLDHHGEYSVLLQWLCDCPLPAINKERSCDNLIAAERDF